MKIRKLLIYDIFIQCIDWSVRIHAELFKHDAQYKVNEPHQISNNIIVAERKKTPRKGPGYNSALITSAYLALINNLSIIHVKIHHSPYARWPWLNMNAPWSLPPPRLFPDKCGLIVQDMPKGIQWSWEITEYLFEAKLKVQSRQTLPVIKRKILLWL